MSKRRIIAVLTAAMMCLLTACGSADTGGVASVSDSEVSSNEDTTVDVGDFTVYVPKGWFGATVEDMSVEPDKDGNYQYRTDAVNVIRGGTSGMDTWTNSTVHITYFPDMDAQSNYEFTTTYEQEITPIENVTVNGTECLAFYGESNYAEEGQEPIMFGYTYVIIPVSDSSSFRVTLDGDDGVAGISGLEIEDSDVMAIMESLTAK